MIQGCACLLKRVLSDPNELITSNLEQSEALVYFIEALNF